MYFLFSNRIANAKKYLVNKSVIHFVGIYFIVISVLFYFLWLSEIVPAVIQNTLPGSIVETGLFTNGVHVIDLAVFLPGTFIIGVFLLKRISLAFTLTPVILTFFILMDITIGTLAVVMKMKGVESNLVVSAIMSLLALFSLILLIWYLKALKPNVTSGNFISS